MEIEGFMLGLIAAFITLLLIIGVGVNKTALELEKLNQRIEVIRVNTK